MRQLGKIHCQEINNHDDAPWILLFHGYGADCNDLFSLGQAIKTKKPYNWLFPNGILEVPIGPGWTGRAWWPVNMMEIQEAANRGEHRDFSRATPQGAEKAIQSAQEMLKQLRVPWSNLILGGFSQGAMLATELFLTAPETPKGLVIMSGTLIDQPRWSELAKNRKGARFFQSHGSADPILGHKQAQQLETALTQAGMVGRLDSFKGGHEIPIHILQKIGSYIDSLA